MRIVYIGIIAAFVFVVGAAYIFSTTDREPSPDRRAPINFEECATAGNPIMESYPRQCRTSDGRTFVEKVDAPPAPPGKESATGSCAVAGCSGTICTGSSEAANIVTTCEYRAEYVCYRLTTCERQPTGACGWTENAAFTACLSNPPPIE